MSLIRTDSLEFIEKSITRAEAKAVHKDLPSGGTWKTIHGHHVYVLGNRIIAGSVPGVTKTKKMTKATMAEHQAKIDAKEKKPSAKKKPTATKKATGNAKPKSGASAKGQGTKKTTAGKTKPAADKSAVKKEPKLIVSPSKKNVEHYELYHGTKLPNVESIKRDGFTMNGSEDDFGDAAYFKSPAFDSLDHDDQQKKIEKFKQSNFSKDAINRMEKHRGNDTTNIVNGFAGREAAVIHAFIPKEHMLDCSKGRPKELQDIINAFKGARRLVERIKVIFKHLLGENLDDLSEDDAHKRYTERKDELSAALGKTRFIAGKISPYEVYAHKHKIGAIVDKLDDYDDEGWQIGVYDPKIIQIKDVGKGIKWNDAKKSPELIKAFIKSLRKAAVPYCLLHHTIDSEGLHMHVGATGGTSK